MEVRFWAKTDTGRVRDHNEDNFLVDKRLQLFVVCDGMGGHAAGEVASAVCVRTVRDIVAAERDLLAQLEADPSRDDLSQQVVAVLERAIHHACARIFEMSAEDSSRRGMGTTCSMLLLHGDRGYISHVGDSRVYVLRQGRVSQLTEDHSLLNEMIRQGKIKPGDDANFPNKNAVTRAVGVREFVEVDAFEIEVEDGDRFLLCSDGLCGYFTSDDQIRGLLSHEDIKSVTDDCVRFANDSGGKDNITVIIIDAEIPHATLSEMPDSFVEVLGGVEFFDYLSPKELHSVVELCERQQFPAGAQVLDGMSLSNDMYVILSGAVALTHEGRHVAIRATGEYFGEMTLVDEANDGLAVEALEPTVLMVVGRMQFMSLLRTQPQLAVKLLWNLLQVFSGRLRDIPVDLLYNPGRWAERETDVIADNTPVSGSLILDHELDALSSLPHYDDLNEETMELDGDLVAALATKKLHGEVATQPMVHPMTQMWASHGAEEDDEEDLRATVQFDRDRPLSELDNPPAPALGKASAARTGPPALPAGGGNIAAKTRKEGSGDRRAAAMEKLKARVLNKAISGESISSQSQRPSDIGAAHGEGLQKSRGEHGGGSGLKKVVIADDLDESTRTADITTQLQRPQKPDHE